MCIYNSRHTPKHYYDPQLSLDSFQLIFYSYSTPRLFSTRFVKTSQSLLKRLETQPPQLPRIPTLPFTHSINIFLSPRIKLWRLKRSIRITQNRLKIRRSELAVDNPSSLSMNISSEVQNTTYAVGIQHPKK